MWAWMQVGVQGDLWFVGAQNAGKSSVVNALKYHAGTRDASPQLTTAPYPGTTLDMVQVDGLPLMARSRAYDTPGVPHHHQLTSRFAGVPPTRSAAPGAAHLAAQQRSLRGACTR
jgi:ribosome biogenesis GTPase A